MRILPTDRSGAVAGQASPTSLLEVDDGLAPGGDFIDNFAMAGANSVVSIVGPDGAKVMNYDPATGTYGSVIASDTSGGQFYVFGVDPAAHTVLVDDTGIASNGTRTDDVELYDTRSGALLGTPDLSGYSLKGGVVDAARDRADLLARIDSGEAYATSGPGSLLCFGGGTSLAEVDPGTGAVTDTTAGTHCDTDLAVDSSAGNLLSVNYRAVSVNFAGSSSLVVMPEANPSADSVYPLRTGAPVELAADPVHHVALVLYALPAGPPKFGAPGGIALTDSNAMSVIDVVDTGTGNIVKTIGSFSSPSVNGYPFATNAGIQLDPATRTGYMFAPGDDQVQQFSY